jgi:hypothetical protein
MMAAPITVKKHAVFSPSAMEANMLCIGKIAMEHGLPDSSSTFADEGTCAHFLGALCLAEGHNAADYLNDVVALWRHDDTGEEGEGFASDKPKEAFTYHSEEVDAVFAGHVQVYVDVIRDYALGNPIMAEQKLSIAEITGEEGATGTSDAVILLEELREIVVADLKFGMGVAVSAENNPQLMTYALSAYHEYGAVAEFDKVRLVISQPRISTAPSEWVCSIEDLIAFGEAVKERAKAAFTALEFRSNWVNEPADKLHYLTPGEKQCKWCKAARASQCKKLDAYVAAAAACDFDDLTVETMEEHSRSLTDPVLIGEKLRAVPMLEIWAAGVRAAAERELLEAKNDPEFIAKMGFKIVQGKKGNRAWKDQDKAERLLRRLMGAANCYKPKVLISPTEAVKAFDAADKNLANVEKMIVQADGKPSVAPLSDKREPLMFEADEFEDLSELDLI